MTRGKPGDSQETRSELLDAGLRLVLRGGLPSGFNVKLTDVVKEARRTTGAAYQIWSTQDEYRLELTAHVARSVAYADTGIVRAALDAVLTPDADLWSVVELTGRAYFQHLVSQPQFFVSLHFWATTDSLTAEVRAAVEESYAEIQRTFEEFFGSVLDHFNVDLVAPHTITELTMAATAATEGAALRHRFARTDAARDTVVDVYIAMLTSTLLEMTTASR